MGSHAVAWYAAHPMEAARRARALLRSQRVSLRKTHLKAKEAELHPLEGVEAISLLTRLSKESHSLAGYAEPTYTRQQIPCRFVPRRPA